MIDDVPILTTTFTTATFTIATLRAGVLTAAGYLARPTGRTRSADPERGVYANP